MFRNQFIGIDFGTTNSCMAWFNPDTRQAEIILNSEGEEKTPSMVYYGEGETLTGKLVEHQIEEVRHLDEAERSLELLRIVKSIKRNLISPPRIPLPDGKSVFPVEVVAEILKKLKTDAEEGCFHSKVSSAVITHPAIFDEFQKEKIREAAILAGFRETKLLEEPIAAALAFAHAYPKIGEGILVYDLGGGTFDLAVVVRKGDSFHLAMETDGDANCGGDDFDQALYNYWETQARSEIGKSFTLDNGVINLDFMLACRRRKEMLSHPQKETITGRSFLADGSSYKASIDRNIFESLIEDVIECTIRKTGAMIERAKNAGIKIQTIVLIGGSSRLLLVERRIREELGFQPLSYSHKDLAVALGAAYFQKSTPTSLPKPEPIRQTKSKPHPKHKSNPPSQSRQGVSDIEEFQKKGDFYYKQGLFKKAFKHYEAALKIKPKVKTAAYFYNRGYIFSRYKDYKSAINELCQAINLYPNYADALYNRGLCYLKLGKPDHAKADFIKIRTLNPDCQKKYPFIRQYLDSKTYSVKHNLKENYSPRNFSNIRGKNSNSLNSNNLAIILILTIFIVGAGLFIVWFFLLLILSGV